MSIYHGKLVPIEEFTLELFQQLEGFDPTPNYELHCKLNCNVAPLIEWLIDILTKYCDSVRFSSNPCEQTQFSYWSGFKGTCFRYFKTSTHIIVATKSSGLIKSAEGKVIVFSHIKQNPWRAADGTFTALGEYPSHLMQIHE